MSNSSAEQGTDGVAMNQPVITGHDLPEGPTPPIPYLYEVLRGLWPGARITSVPPGRRGEGLVYLALPKASRPALLLPAGPPAVTATALREARTGGTAGRRRLLRLASAATRLGAARLVPGRISVVPAGGDRESLLGTLERALGEQLYASIPGSPPRANRKPVLHLINAQGTTVGFAKLGVTRLTRELVRREGEVLDQLAGSHLPNVRVPRALFRGTHGNVEVMVQEPLVPRGSQERDADILARRAQEVSVSAGETRQPWAGSPYAADLRRRMAGLDHPRWGAAMLDLLDRLDAQAPAGEMVFGSWHGDFAPWNMAWDGDQLLLWDWERFTSGVPLGYDIVHYAIQVAVARKAAVPAVAARSALADAEGLLRPVGLDAEAARFTVLAYVLEIATRYTEDHQWAYGRPLADLDAWALPLLEEQLTRG